MLTSQLEIHLIINLKQSPILFPIIHLPQFHTRPLMSSQLFKHKFCNKMIIQVIIKRYIVRKILCWNLDLKPQPSNLHPPARVLPSYPCPIGSQSSWGPSCHFCSHQQHSRDVEHPIEEVYNSFNYISAPPELPLYWISWGESKKYWLNHNRLTLNEPRVGWPLL